MRVLVGCEFSGIVRRAFREAGHDAWSCDLLPAEDGSPHHLHGDVRKWLHEGWDMGIFHPPCTRLANSGVRWLHERNLWAELDEACDLFRACLDAPIPRVCVENPVMHSHARERIGVRHTQTVQPWQFGHGEVKRTCFWLRNLPPLVPTEIVSGREARVHRMPPGPDRWKERSRFFDGIARAMADQWGSLDDLPDWPDWPEWKADAIASYHASVNALREIGVRNGNLEPLNETERRWAAEGPVPVEKLETPQCPTAATS